VVRNGIHGGLLPETGQKQTRRVHANIQRDGTFSVVPPMKGGVTNSSQLRRIAEVADKYAIPMIKLTGGQRIDLLGVRKEDLPAVWADLDMPSGYAYGKSFRTVEVCVGSDFCRYGPGDSTAWCARCAATPSTCAPDRRPAATTCRCAATPFSAVDGTIRIITA
jgi:NAD(P)H-nitrite reductase large subunit